MAPRRNSFGHLVAPMSKREESSTAEQYLAAKTSTAAEAWSRAPSRDDSPKHEFCAKENPLNSAGFLSVATMWWMHPLLKRGYEAPLDEASVWDLPSADQARPLQAKFDQLYAAESRTVAGLSKRNCTLKRPNVNRAIWESVKETWGIAFVLHLVSAGLILFQPLVIKAILQNISSRDNSIGISSGYLLAALLGCTALASATTLSAGQFLTTRVACNARMICINSAFQKILRLSATARRTMDTGEIVTFVGVDSDRVLAAYKLGMWCVVSPLMLVAVSILIGTQMHVLVALASAAAIMVIIYASLLMSTKIGNYRRQISRISAERLKVTNEMLQGIRVVKFYGWEGFANDLIGEIRGREIALLRKYNRVRLANTVLMFLAPTLLNLVCFTTTILLGNTLDVPTTFAIVALTNACRTPFSIFADASVAVAEAVTSTSRLSDFLAAGETDDSNKEEIAASTPPVISLENAAFQWEQGADTPTLSNMNLTLEEGSLTVVVGAVGSGKSSLVSAILGEMQQVCGSRLVRGNIAYASQQPWVRNQTVRDNILFGEPYEAEHYQRVITACQLDQDFGMLEHGDQTEIGERGINLSGGQKARIGVARAMVMTLERKTNQQQNQLRRLL